MHENSKALCCTRHNCWKVNPICLKRQWGCAAQGMATQTYQHMIMSLIQSSTATAVLLLALEEACLEQNRYLYYAMQTYPKSHYEQVKAAGMHFSVN